MILSVPLSAMLSVDKAHKDPIVGKIVYDNPEIFRKERKHANWNEQLILTVFLMHEKNKGEESFWHPYITHMPQN